MKSIVPFIAFMSFLCCCSERKGDRSVSIIMENDHEIIVTSLNSLKPDTAIIPLSSLVEDCTFVQLEFTEEALFNPWWTTITDKYIGVLQEEGSYKLFDRSGKFLCNVGSVGQGPGEYRTTLYDDIIDDKNELIYLIPFGGDKILVYNTSGQFLKNLNTPQMMSPRLFLSDDILTVIFKPNMSNESGVIQIDVATEQILNEWSTQIAWQGYEDGIFGIRNEPTRFNIAHELNDTLYRIDVKNNTIAPFFAISYNSSEKLYKGFCKLNQDLVMTFTEQGIVATDLKHKTASWVKVVNDYYGNLDVKVSLVSFYNGYFVQNIQPEQLMDDIEQRLTEQTCTEKDRQILQKTLSSLKENTNNVVFIGKLKKDYE